jgi:D-tagatose-1,6-bisphosphate aldolase subunit GatZ/KbaZ
MKTKFFIGPMSKNVVDAIILFNKTRNENVGIIPSRRQIESTGGYSNNWTTKELRKYAPDLIIKRDHAGPGQGNLDDDGYDSLKEDCKYMDFIHIDPWKKYTSYKDGMLWTVEMINFCHSLNPEIKFEVGTEESIRKFDDQELKDLLNDLKNHLSESAFNQIKYLVIQSGTSLINNLNTGNYDRDRLLKMIKVSNKFNLLSKEHNGDYISEKLIFEKMSLGLDSINIAPEFGLIETQTYLEEIADDQLILNKFWEICYESKRWEKWVDEKFDPKKNKIDLIKICGHYVFSQKNFINEIKLKFKEIDERIIKNILNKLNKLHGYKT